MSIAYLFLFTMGSRFSSSRIRLTSPSRLRRSATVFAHSRLAAEGRTRVSVRAGIGRQRRTQAAVLSDRRIFADRAIGIDHDALPQPCPVADMAARSYSHGCRNFGFRFDDGARVDSRNGAALGAEQLRRPGVIDLGVVAQDPGQGGRVPLLARHSDARGARVAMVGTVTAVMKV